MNVLKMLAANAEVGGNQTLYQIIDGLGLTTNLKVCLDAGDSASYDSSVQTNKWLDTSGGGYDFFRGTSSSGDVAEPTFNGSTAGLSSAEYWSFDGGDRFTYDTTNETWMQNLHKDGAISSMICMFYNLGSGNTYNHLANCSSTTGIIFSKPSSNTLRLFIRNLAGATVFQYLSAATKTAAGWTYMAYGMDEPANSLVVKFDDNDESTTCTYVNPSNGSAQYTTTLGSNTNSHYPSGARMACFAAWEGTALTSQNLTDIYDALKGRFEL